jgi:hypothetical protein
VPDEIVRQGVDAHGQRLDCERVVSGELFRGTLGKDADEIALVQKLRNECEIGECRRCRSLRAETLKN